jgi:hypothetical protein
MTSTFVNDLRLNEQGTGDNSGSWGTVTNTNLELIGDAFGYGTEAITTNANTHNTIIVNAPTASVGRSMFLKYTGALDSACTITITNSDSDFTISKLWFIHNATTGGEDIIITSGSGANVTIPAGHTKCIYTDGAGSGGAVVDGFAGLSAGANFYVKNPATADNSTANIYLQTAEADIAVNDVLGKINFQAPDETSHASGDNKLVAAAIQAISEGDFSQTNNATSLAFMTAASEAATTKMTLSSVGDLTLTSTTASSSSTTGALTVGGGLGVAADLFVGDDFDVTGDAVIDGTALVTGVLTTTAATVFNGGFASNADSTMGTDKKLFFRDSAIHISSTADGDMSIAADDEIDITSTLIDINGNVEIGGTIDATTSAQDAYFFRGSHATTTNFYITNTNATTNNVAQLLLCPANNVAGAYLSAIATEDFSTSANRTADLAFYTRLNGTFGESMRLDSSGKIIGSTGTGRKLLVGDYTSTSSGSPSSISLGSRFSDTAGEDSSVKLQIYENKFDNTAADYTMMGIGVSSNQMDYVASETAFVHAFWTGGTKRLTVQSTAGNNVVVADGLTLTNGNLVIGTAGKGIDFSAQTPASGITPSAEILDHYEEGTFTPVFGGGGNAGTYEQNTGTSNATYTRIGNQVFIEILANSASSVTGGGSSYLRLSGLPFNYPAGVKNVQSEAILNFAFTGVTCFAVQSASAASDAMIFIGVAADGTSTNVPVSAYGASKQIRMSFKYTTAL